MRLLKDVKGTADRPGGGRAVDRERYPFVVQAG
ncbi:hypothetical protein T190_30295 [Sinorhizobium meliloti CCBAU 01290]|nr:hypothetical protein T190_30295 [Sinorhizobium meliloti CCBAU 01290]